MCCIFYSSHVFLSGNVKRAIYILKSAIEEGAEPKEHLKAALQSVQAGETQFCSEDKENLLGVFSFTFY